MISATDTARSLLAVALLSCTFTASARAAPHNAPRHTAPHAIKTRINPKDGAVMAYVHAGTFPMGSSEQEGFSEDHTQHTVYLDAFWIYENDVMVAQYRKFCKATGRKMPLRPNWGWTDDHPIVSVTWDDAKAYCDWAEASLPTEAQWEKAARGADGRTFPWGDKWDRRKLRCSKKEFGDAGGTAPVGSYPRGASPYGCLDMVGNVLQWCADWYDEDYYAHSPTRNPVGPAFGDERVERGGSWVSHLESNFRCANRGFGGPDGGNNGIGFRCVVRAGG